MKTKLFCMCIVYCLAFLAHGQTSWKLDGNSGTIPGTHFLGTTDTNALELKVNNARVLRLEPGSSPIFIGGHSENYVLSGVIGATISGGGASGQTNQVTRPFGSVGGGRGNLAGGIDSTVAGGYQNVNFADQGVIAGGGRNTNSGIGCTIAGGVGNYAGPAYSTVSGGRGNTASASFSTIVGGLSNTANAAWSTVVGGIGNTASGFYSLAGGYEAKAIHRSAFVWADSIGREFASTADNQFLIRAGGGVGIGKSNPQAQLDDEGSAAVSGNVGVGTTFPQAKLDVAGKVRCEVLELTSDRNVKGGFTNVNGREILSKVARLPIGTWHYTNSPGVRHVGPMAQDFQAAFGVGEDEQHLSVVDGIGVALASIQALQHELLRRDEQLQQKDARIAALELKLVEQEQTITARFAALENLISHSRLRPQPEAQPTQSSDVTRIDKSVALD